jgi:tetratricopeptide (TPR) repeat protein
VLGPDHPDVATSTNNLAAVLTDLGRPVEAEPLHRRALALRERVLGPDHPAVATATNNLALVLRDLGRPAEAEPMLARALAIRERTLDPDYSLNRSVHDGLAELSAQLGPTPTTGTDATTTTSRMQGERSPAAKP